MNDLSDVELDLHYRVLTIDDLQSCFELERQAHSHPWSKAQILSALQRYSCNGVEVDGKLIAFAVYSCAVGEAELLDIVVSPSYQGQGVGSRFLDWLLAHAVRVAGARCLYLEVRESNVAAQAVYRNAGLAEVGVRQGYYPAVRGREDAIIMAMELV